MLSVQYHCISGQHCFLYFNMQVGAPKDTRKAILRAVFGPDGVAGADNTLVDEARQAVRQLCSVLPDSATTYIETRIFPLLDENRSAGRSTWTNNNAESMNSVLKNKTDWHRQRLPDLIDTIKSVVDGQHDEEIRTLYRVGDYKLAPIYESYAVCRERWKAMSTEQRKRAVKQFRANSRPAGPTTHVTSSDGKLRIRQPTGSRKPHQTQRPTANRTYTRVTRR